MKEQEAELSKFVFAIGILVELIKYGKKSDVEVALVKLCNEANRVAKEKLLDPEKLLGRPLTIPPLT